MTKEHERVDKAMLESEPGTEKGWEGQDMFGRC
jgi:hypothetical protein